MTVVHVLPYSARMPGGHSNAIRGFIDCQRAVGIAATGLSPATDEVFANAVELGPHIVETRFDDPARLVRRLLEQKGETGGIVHLHAINNFSTELARLAKAAGIRVVMTSHGQLNSRSLLHAAKKSIYFSTRRSPLSYADAVHFLTERESRKFRLLVPLYRGRIATISHAIDLIADDAYSATAQFLITHIGRIDVAHKGLDLLLAGFHGANIKNAKLVLAGPDWNNGKETLLKQATQLGCLDHVSIPGPVYGEDKILLLKQSNLFVATSRWEAFGISLVEAMAAGTPTLISSKLNLAPSLAKADVAEVVKCSAPAIAAGLRQLAADAERRAALGRRGREWALANCSPEKVGLAFREFYQDVLSA